MIPVYEPVIGQFGEQVSRQIDRSTNQSQAWHQVSIQVRDHVNGQVYWQGNQQVWEQLKVPL